MEKGPEIQQHELGRIVVDNAEEDMRFSPVAMRFCEF
jgi:hypothetical protein